MPTDNRPNQHIFSGGARKRCEKCCLHCRKVWPVSKRYGVLLVVQWDETNEFDLQAPKKNKTKEIPVTISRLWYIVDLLTFGTFGLVCMGRDAGLMNFFGLWTARLFGYRVVARVEHVFVPSSQLCTLRRQWCAGDSLASRITCSP